MNHRIGEPGLPGHRKGVIPMWSPINRRKLNWRPIVWSLRSLVLSFLCLALVSGCASNEDWVRFRPDATSPFSGVEQPNPKPYTGQTSLIYGTYELDEDVQNLGNVDGYGLWVSARMSEWYIAPEFGFLQAEENDGVLGKIRDAELFAGGRVTAELPFTPFSVFGGAGISMLTVDEYDFNADENGVYFHGGALLHLGDNAHIGVDYRLSTYDSISDRSVFSVMTGVNW